MTVIPEVERVLTTFHGAGKPLALCCIAPVLAARVLGAASPSLTLGNTGSEADWPYQGAIEAAESFGANMVKQNSFFFIQTRHYGSYNLMYLFAGVKRSGRSLRGRREQDSDHTRLYV